MTPILSRFGHFSLRVNQSQFFAATDWNRLSSMLILPPPQASLEAGSLLKMIV